MEPSCIKLLTTKKHMCNAHKTPNHDYTAPKKKKNCNPPVTHTV